MALIHVEAERTLLAEPADVYAFLADYRENRPTILPPNYEHYGVDQGGRGAGTVVHYVFQAARRSRSYRMQVTEPADGQVLREQDLGSSLVTTWTVAPAGAGRTRVQVKTEWQGGHGIGGFFERTFAHRGLLRIYEQMLNRLAHAVERGGSGASTK